MVKRQPCRSNRIGTYEADEDDIKQKEQDLADFENEERINAIQKEIDALNDYKDLWDKITDKWQEASDKMKASELFGSDWEDRVNDCTLDVEDFGDKYYNVCQDIETLTKQTAQDILDQYEDMFGRIADLMKINHPTTSTRNVRYFYATKDGTAPNGVQIGDRILTGGGVYEIVDPARADEEGVGWNPNSQLYSKKVESEKDLITTITEANAGQYAYSKTIEELNDDVLVSKKSIDRNTTNTSSNTNGLNINSSTISTNSAYIDDATDSVDDLNKTMQYLPDDIKDAVSDAIQKSIEDNTYAIDEDGGGTNNPKPGISYDNKGNPISIDEDSFLKGLEKLKETVGEDSDAYKSARDYYLSMFGERGEKVFGINANKNAGYNGGTYSNFEDYFNSYNPKSIGGGFYEFTDSHGHTTAANKSWFENSYIYGRPSGYTDREHAQSILDKMNELDVLDDWLNDPNSREYTKRQLDIVNTVQNGDKQATIKAREEAERAYREIINAKYGDGSETSAGSYDATGKKITSISYDRNHNLVGTTYSDRALDFSDIVDSITEIPDAKEIYDSEIFKRFYDDITGENSYYNYKNNDPNNNVDTNRAYNSSYNKQFNDLKISTDRQDKDLKSNSDKLKENSNAMDILNDTFGEGAYDLKEGINGVVEVVDKATDAIIGTVNTKNGQIYNNGSYKGSGGSGGSGGGNSHGSLSSDGTYRSGYSQSDKDAIQAAQKAYKEAEAKGDKAAMNQAHRQAESIRNKYGDSSDSTGVIGGSKSSSSSSSGGSKNSSSSSNNSSSNKSSVGSIVGSVVKTIVSITVPHAKGTGKIKTPHYAIVDDAGTELVKRGIGRGTYLEYGDQVFPHEESQAILNTYENMKGNSNRLEDFVPAEIPSIFKQSSIADNMTANVYSDMFTGVSGLAKTFNTIGSATKSQQTNNNIIYQYDFDKLVLPNVENGNQLIMQLKNLSSDALQRSNRR